jgi:hypothetical protein
MFFRHGRLILTSQSTQSFTTATGSAPGRSGPRTGRADFTQIARVRRRSGKVAADPWTLSQTRGICRRSLEAAGDPDDFPQIARVRRKSGKVGADPWKLRRPSEIYDDLQRSKATSRNLRKLLEASWQSPEICDALQISRTISRDLQETLEERRDDLPRSRTTSRDLRKNSGGSVAMSRDLRQLPEIHSNFWRFTPPPPPPKAHRERGRKVVGSTPR